MSENQNNEQTPITLQSTPPPAGPTPDPKQVAEARRNAAFNWMIAIAAIAVFTLMYPAMAQTVLVFIAILGVLVFVHEWGHYQFGRWAGMRVNRFGVGFPPWIYTKRYNGVDYSIGALPIGGMVDIAGLGSEEEMVATAKRDEDTLSESQRRARHDVPHGQKLFQDARLGWRFWTLFAGPLMNFLFAIVMFVGVFTIWGVIERQTTVNRLAAVNYGTPADKAGLQAGDVIVAVNGIQTDQTAIISQQIRNSGSRFAEATSAAPNVAFNARAETGGKPIVPVTLTVQRSGESITKEISPTFQDIPYPTASGLSSMRMPALGVEFEQQFQFKKVGVGEAVTTGVLMSYGMTVQLLKIVGRAFTFQLNQAERSSIGGPVKIAQEVGKASKGGPQNLMLFAGLLSMNLGLMNLLPFPALDGGRILFLGYELVFRKPIDAKKESIVHMAGMVMLLAFMLFITVRDVLPWLERSLRSVFNT